MARYRSKPTEIEAVQWRGDNWREVETFAADHVRMARIDPHLLAGKDGAQGWVPVPEGHWIVRSPGDLTDHWPVDPEYFAGKYEPAEASV